MKRFKTFMVLAVFFSLTARSFSQMPDRVLSAEEFRQQKIEEKRQQLKREIQVGMNDRIKYGYLYGIPDEYIFLKKTYPYKEHKRIFEGENNELKYIFDACDDNTKKLFFEDLKRFFFIYENHPNGNINWKKLQIEHKTLANMLLASFNTYLSMSSQNREKIAQAIRDYRLAEFIKNELPGIVNDRQSDITVDRISSEDFRFLGVVLGLGFGGKYSDNYRYYKSADGEDKYNLPPFHVDFSFRFAHLFHFGKYYNIGFMVDLGFWTNTSEKHPVYFGGNIMIAFKMKRVVIGLGGYFYFASKYTAEYSDAIIQYKKTDVGIIGCLNYYLGSQMRFFIGTEMRINLNTNILVYKYDVVTGTYLKPDEVGYISFVFKFGFRF